ncbi:MAG: ATP-binding response regulator [Bacteroidales bacterium]
MYEFWWSNEAYRKLLNKHVTGIFIGLSGVILMFTPWPLVPGIIFDTRSVLLSVTGLFFGFVPTVVAMLITVIFRVLQGGGGMWMGIACIGENITERKKAEAEILNAKLKAEENDRLKSEFLANMSHEIRTPLNAIVGFSNLLCSHDTSNEKRNQFQSIISNSSERLLNLINDIVDLSKLEAGQLSINLCECNVYDLVKNCIEAARISPEYINKENLILRMNVPEELKINTIINDPKRIQQVLDNLVSNAIKYTSRGYVESGVKIIRRNNRNYLEFYVKDTGTGIPEDKKKIIFERFRKLDENKYKEGAGLGLSISKGIVELLGGNIYLESEYGKGSTFYFTIPYNPAKSTEMAQGESMEKIIDIKNKKILIAEDDINSFLYIKHILGESGSEIYHALNGKTTLELVEEVNPDIILLDLCMPVIDGFEVLEILKENKNNAVIIAQTAYAMSGEKERCLMLGCHGYIAKPFNRKELIRTISEAILKCEPGHSHTFLSPQDIAE